MNAAAECLTKYISFLASISIHIYNGRKILAEAKWFFQWFNSSDDVPRNKITYALSCWYIWGALDLA